MKKLSETVHFDLERNSFYKINKSTGQEILSYRNGEPLKKFKPQITGIDYHLRKVREASEDSPKSINFKTIYFPSKRSHHLSKLHQYRTIDAEGDRNSIDDPSMSLRKSYQKLNQQISKVTSIKNHELIKRRRNSHLEESEQPSQQPNNKQKQQLFNLTMLKYQDILSKKVRQNNSPKKQTIPGSEEREDPLKTVCATIQVFNHKQPNWKRSRQVRHRKNMPTQYVSEFKLKDQIMKERHQFHSIHKHKFKQPKQFNEDVHQQRKKNLLILQRLFIKQNDKQTQSIIQ